MNRRQFLRNAVGAAVATQLPAAAPLTAADIRKADAALKTASVPFLSEDWYPAVVSYKVMFSVGVLPELTQRQRVHNTVIAGHMDYLKVSNA